MAPPPTFAPELWNLAYVFNTLAIFIDVAPLWIACHLPLEDVGEYFSVRSSLTGAFVNFILVCHILFAVEPKDHLDSLFVAMAGMCFGICCAYLCLLHKLIVHKSPHARNWMSLLMLSVVIGSSLVMYGIGSQFRADEGWGKAIIILAAGGTIVLNEVPYLQALVAGLEVETDIRVDGLGMVFSFLTTIDSSYFVAYAHFLGSFGSLFSLIAYITAVSCLIQFFLFLDKMHDPIPRQDA